MPCNVVLRAQMPRHCWLRLTWLQFLIFFPVLALTFNFTPPIGVAWLMELLPRFVSAYWYPVNNNLKQHH